MDLVSLIRRSVDILRNNWILLAPTLIVHLVVPVVVIIAAVIAVLPLVAAYLSSGGAVSVLPLVGVAGIVVVIVALLIVSYALAGQGYMNLQTALGRRTKMADFLQGGRKYFAKVLGTVLILAVLFGLPVLVLLGTAYAALAPLVSVPFGRMPRTSAEWTSVFAIAAPRLSVSLLTVASTIFLIGLIELIVYILTLPWLQAVMVEEVGPIRSLARCFGFVRRNFLTVLGYIGLTALVGGLVGGLSAGPYMFLPFYSAFRLGTVRSAYLPLTWGGLGFIAFIANILITTFFTLLLFVVYVDRTRGLPVPAPPAEPVRPPQAPSMPPVGKGKYCIYCGSIIQEDAIYCHRCGKLQEHPSMTGTRSFEQNRAQGGSVAEG